MWKVETSTEKVARTKMSRMEILDGQWIVAALEVHAFFYKQLTILVSTQVAYFFAKNQYWNCLFLPHFCQKA